ncbi:MAG: endonuclease VIII [Clostridiales bacterium]|nr:endonuclease VIII [Clostridiales bacterium]
MLEIPESHALARQAAVLTGKVIAAVSAAASPHKFAFYFGDPADYPKLLVGEKIGGARVHGGMTEICAGEARLLFHDGVNARYYAAGEAVPAKHQLYIGFEDGSALVCTVQMYGGLWAFRAEENDNPYYLVAREKPSPLSREFDEGYFTALLNEETGKLSAKAFLATEQRIPGLGNGVLQDILWSAKIHPRRRMNTLAREEFAGLYQAVKGLLAEMTALGGRDTEKDLRGRPGGYPTVMSKNNAGGLCPACGGTIRREAYLGGNVYFCESCQPNR